MEPQSEGQDQDNGRSSREQTPDIGEVEKERVRHIVQGWRETSATKPTPAFAQRIIVQEQNGLGKLNGKE
ncbi:hypothetical protein HanRHA438_Chr11g0523631 [Helianthus annuus]|nr:hypothetical protein HanRHA438_Chr11g0523631 [Helianthus annuus]KAJ0876823.1 hypothetical protein HanPSC8_Chr11g0492851 [Helianthus annuus]